MYLAASIFLIFLLTQFILGLRSWGLRNKLQYKYAFILGSQIEVSEVIERYFKKNKKLVIKASDQLDDVAYSEHRNFYINKHKLYSKDLYSNIYTLFYLEIANCEDILLREIPVYQNILFVSQFLFFVIAIVLPAAYSVAILIIGIIMELVTLFVTILALLKHHEILDSVLANAKRYLKLDAVEEARAEALVNDLKYRIFEYPFELTWRIYQFIKP